MNEAISPAVLALIAKLDARIAALESKPPVLTKPDLERFKAITKKDDGA